MKKNIYLFFSLLGFMVLFLESGIKTIIKCIKDKNLTLWLNLLGKVFLWWVGFIMLPAGIAMIFLEKIMAFNYIVGNAYNAFVLVYIYVAGVVITRKLYDWKLNNLDV